MFIIMVYLISVVLGAAVFFAGFVLGWKSRGGESPTGALDEAIAKRGTAIIYPAAPSKEELPPEV